MAEVDSLIGLDADGVRREWATPSKLLKSLGLPADPKEPATGATPATMIALLKQVSASVQALEALIAAGKLAVADEVAATGLATLLETSFATSDGQTALATLIGAVNAAKYSDPTGAADATVIAALKAIAAAAVSTSPTRIRGGYENASFGEAAMGTGATLIVGLNSARAWADIRNPLSVPVKLVPAGTDTWDSAGRILKPGDDYPYCGIAALYGVTQTSAGAVSFVDYW